MDEVARLRGQRQPRAQDPGRRAGAAGRGGRGRGRRPRRGAPLRRQDAAGGAAADQPGPGPHHAVPGAGREPVPDPRPVELDMVVAEALDRCRMSADARGITIDLAGAPRPVRAGRRGPAGHRAAQPGGERRRLQPGTHPGGRLGSSRPRRQRRDLRGRPGHRHPRARPGADLRALLPGRPGPLPRHRRHRPGLAIVKHVMLTTTAGSRCAASRAPARPSPCHPAAERPRAPGGTK